MLLQTRNQTRLAEGLGDWGRGGLGKEDRGAHEGRLKVVGGQGPALTCPNISSATSEPARKVLTIYSLTCQVQLNPHSVPVPEQRRDVIFLPFLHLRKGGTGLAQEHTAGGWQEEGETPDS